MRPGESVKLRWSHALVGNLDILYSNFFDEAAFDFAVHGLAGGSGGRKPEVGGRRAAGASVIGELYGQFTTAQSNGGHDGHRVEPHERRAFRGRSKRKSGTENDLRGRVECFPRDE